jgi:hypothetical protein
MVFDHIGIRVPPRAFSATLAFYLSALKPLGYKEMMRPIENCVGLGINRAEFFVTADPDVSANQKIHLAFKAESMCLSAFLALCFSSNFIRFPCPAAFH